jgi:hypothetical protein
MAHGRRSKPPIDCAEALKRSALPASRRTSAVGFANRIRFPHPHAGAGGARSRAISDRISANICRDTGRVAEGNFAPPPSRNRT